MELAAILALVQAASALIPVLAEAVGPVERLTNGTGTQADVDALQAITATINAQAEAAEKAAGATG